MKNKEKDNKQNKDKNLDKENDNLINEQPTQDSNSSDSEKLKEELRANEDKIKQYEALLEEGKDRYLRLQADFDNYRKRIAKEREDIFSSALEDIMTQLLPVADNFERALDSFKTSNLDKKYTEGLEMIYKDFFTILCRSGLEEIEALGCEFDPNKHHAVMQVEAGDEDENKIKDIFQKGYMLKSKVIRPSMVKVAVKN